jgi:hypothetical protein
MDGQKAQHIMLPFAVYMKNGMAKETMLSCASIKINANNPVAFGKISIPNISMQHCHITIK